MQKKERIRHKMVGWYDPFQLAVTGYEVLVSAMFGKHADRRVIQAVTEAAGGRTHTFHEIPMSDPDEFWFDYVSDVGDGFNSTYSIAYYATRDRLKVATLENGSIEHSTRRGELLVFGGDEVYPTAGAAAYEERLVFPYNTALPKKNGARPTNGRQLPALFAIPGNHDWYDSLAVFMNLFCRGREFCGWKTYQNRSYFAVKLPQGWWLFGTDMQLSSSLDDPQMDYFKTIVKDHLQDGDRIILCNAEPYWITDKMYRDDPNYNNRNMGFFEGHILDHKTAIHLAGDRHYYKRHEEISNRGKPVDSASSSKIQKIVAGGGGAFLHPTHRENVDTVGRDHLFKHAVSYPTERTSFWLTFRNLLFPILNPKFGLVTGTLYLLTAQAFRTDLSRFSLSDVSSALKAVVLDVVYEPNATLWVFLIFLGFYLFTDTHTRYIRFIAGPIHAICHFTGVFVLGWAAAYGLRDLSTVWQVVISVLVLFGGGYVLGSIIFGFYLLTSLNIFGIHHNEAFSSIKEAGFKNFLRFKISVNGDLTIYPIGIRRPIRDWKAGDKKIGEAEITPAVYPVEAPYKPFLIEEPIKFSKPIIQNATTPPRNNTDKADPGVDVVNSVATHPIEIG